MILWRGEEAEHFRAAVEKYLSPWEALSPGRLWAPLPLSDVTGVYLLPVYCPDDGALYLYMELDRGRRTKPVSFLFDLAEFATLVSAEELTLASTVQPGEEITIPVGELRDFLLLVELVMSDG